LIYAKAPRYYSRIKGWGNPMEEIANSEGNISTIGRIMNQTPELGH